MAGPGQPLEHRLGGCEGARLARGHGQLDERHEPPVRSAPLLVRVHAEAAIGLLASEERPHDRPGEDALGVGLSVLAEYVSASQMHNRRLARREQPLDRGLDLHARMIALGPQPALVTAQTMPVT